MCEISFEVSKCSVNSFVIVIILSVWLLKQTKSTAEGHNTPIVRLSEGSKSGFLGPQQVLLKRATVPDFCASSKQTCVACIL